MKENILQSKLFNVILQESLVDFISEKESLNEATRINDDKNSSPYFSIDSLLKKRYSESAKRVLACLGDYEVISSESIKNISLNKKEKLFPDLILFNRSSAQIILIENKTSGQTEREAITELMGYAHEIRNHLPFISNYDISYILISTTFNVLLDHSVSAQILSTDINFLCLKPVVAEDEVLSLAVHIPGSWSNIGESELPENALMSYSLFLSEKEGVDIESFDVKSKVRIAADLILHNATDFRSSGFYIIWSNELKNISSQSGIGISIYILNPFAFLPHAVKNNFPLNTESALAKYLKDYVNETGTTVYPSSLFRICDQAEEFLSQYFNLEWDRNTDWIIDCSDKYYALQRNVLQWDSWGAIGNYVRYLFLHPSNETSNMFTSNEQLKGTYLNPFIGLQIINRISGNTLFKDGIFSHKDISKFGVQIGDYLYACQLAIEKKSKPKIMNANLFWCALFLVQSLKEIEQRVNDGVDFIFPKQGFPVTPMGEEVRDNYLEVISDFIEWFRREFILEDQNPTLSYIFQLSITHCWYFDFGYRSALESKKIIEIEKEIADLIKQKVAEIVSDRVKKREENLALIEYINSNYYSGNFELFSQNEYLNFLDSVPDSFYAEGFQTVFLPLLDMIKPTLIHTLRDYSVSESVDWAALKKTAIAFFRNGERKIAILLAVNGTIGIGITDIPILQVNNEDEILVVNQKSGTSIGRKAKWSEILDGSFQF
jgi:hypothetical protein